MTSSIQRIQDALSQASLRSKAQDSVNAAGQSLVCSFEIEGRTQEGYLGVNSIAEVTPPWFPKDAFQLRGRCEKPASPMITLRQEQSGVASGHANAQSIVRSSRSVEAYQTVAVQQDAASAGEQSLSEGRTSALALAQSSPGLGDRESDPVTAEALAELFEQAASTPLSSKAVSSKAEENFSAEAQAVEPQAIEPQATDAMQLIADLEPAPSHPSLLTPISQTERAAAQTLAQALSQQSTNETTLGEANASEADGDGLRPAQVSTDEPQTGAVSIKPIETVARPALPRSKPPEFSVHQNRTNPMLPLELLQNIGQEVLVWQEALKAVHQKIQSLYQEGPILNGWLEKPAYNAAYLICGLDETGQSWRLPCPAEELQQTSLAIGRYKRLRSLLGEKQRLDQRIKRLSETLTMLRLRLRAY